MSYTYQMKKTLWDYITRFYHREYDRSGYYLGVDRETYKSGRLNQTLKQLRAYRIRETKKIIESNSRGTKQGVFNTFGAVDVSEPCRENVSLDKNPDNIQSQVVLLTIPLPDNIQGTHRCYDHSDDLSLVDLVEEQSKMKSFDIDLIRRTHNKP